MEGREEELLAMCYNGSSITFGGKDAEDWSIVKRMLFLNMAAMTRLL